MQVNNEIGSIQPLNKIGNIIKNYNKNIFFHVDAVQGFGKILIKPDDWQIDLLSISGHKFHGPKGIGALLMKSGIKLKPLFNGGGQEAELRSGTENVPGLAGLIPAVKELPNFNQKQQQDQTLIQLKNICIKKIQKKFPQARINTPISNSAPHIINISFPNLKGEVLVHALEEEGIYVSTGSACNSRNKKGSQVLNAISVPPKYIEGTIRISLSKYNTEAEINYVIEKLQQKVDFLDI
jgi:cysteine desulfurase